MNKCPICKTKVEKENQGYCLNCAWEFEYYFDELSKESKKIYEDRLKIWSDIYNKLTAFEKGIIASNVSVKKTFDFEPEMVHIKRGEFMMGSDEFIDTKPVHKVTIDYDFEIGKYPVTFKEYDYYCEEVNKYKPEDNGFERGKRPVINISWNDAKEYAKWLSEKTGKYYRLPSEAEWEFVARAGTQSKWSFGDSENDLKEYAWYDKNSNGKTHVVGSKKANQWGVCDMYGHVWEWCEDWYLDRYKNTPKDGTAQGEKIGVVSKILNEKVLRGGSWGNLAYVTFSASRYKNTPTNRFNYIGFRLLRTLPS